MRVLVKIFFIFFVSALFSCSKKSGKISGVLSLSTGEPRLAYDQTPWTVHVGDNLMILPKELEDNGSAILSCEISPRLPEGLSIHSKNCIISGSPLIPLPLTTFTVTVRNSAGTFSEEFFIKVLSNSFITQWDTTQISPSSSGEDQVRLPLLPQVDYDFRVDWGDGTTSEIKSWDDPGVIHTYENSGIYVVTMTGAFPALNFSQDNLKIMDVINWGTNKWISMESMFMNCSNLNTFSALDEPDLSQVFDMSSMFSGATAFNHDIEKWNTSQVTNMNFMFYNAVSFNQNIGNWDISNVTTMIGMFQNASSFNQDLSAWKVDKVSNSSDFDYLATSWQLGKPLFH